MTERQKDGKIKIKRTERWKDGKTKRWKGRKKERKISL